MGSIFPALRGRKRGVVSLMPVFAEEDQLADSHKGEESYIEDTDSDREGNIADFVVAEEVPSVEPSN
jgi:hypothetical protein